MLESIDTVRSNEYVNFDDLHWSTQWMLAFAVFTLSLSVMFAIVNGMTAN